MIDVITVATMRESDAHTIAHYVPSRELMRRAAQGVFQAVSWYGQTAILAGSGNNGGDGYALAEILAKQGIACTVYRVSDRFSSDGQFYHDRAVACGVPVKEFTGQEDLSSYDILVDCLLGTGFSGPVRGKFRQAIEAINRAKGAQVVSVDINSGMHGDTGRGELMVRSDLTVTIGYLKTGLLLADAAWQIGRLVVADIGIRLIRDDYFLATPGEVVFPNSGFSLHEDRVILLTPGEAEDLSKNGQTVPEVAQEIALRENHLVRVLGRHSLVTDGYRLYFEELGAYPQQISSLGDA